MRYRIIFKFDFVTTDKNPAKAIAAIANKAIRAIHLFAKRLKFISWEKIGPL